jgi:FKBP-type peptidyl-prolyl cis-trans isomerase SlyD
MQVSKDAVVTIGYTLKNDQGELIESTSESDAFTYLHGRGRLLPALESALEGKNSGDSLEISLSPEDGYGPRDDSMVLTLPSSKFDDPNAVKVGTRFVAKVGEDTHIFKIVNVEGDQVTVDGNHPLAGMGLHFDIDVKEVRQATDTELEENTSPS